MLAYEHQREEINNLKENKADKTEVKKLNDELEGFRKISKDLKHIEKERRQLRRKLTDIRQVYVSRNYKIHTFCTGGILPGVLPRH